MGTIKGNRQTDDRSQTLLRSSQGRIEHNNRALAVLLKELNITLWSVDKTEFFRVAPILQDMLGMSYHLNWAYAMRRAGLNIATLRMAVSRGSNPTFQTIVRLLYGMGLRLRIEPDPALTMVVQTKTNPRHMEKGYKRNPTWWRREEKEEKAKKKGGTLHRS